MDLMKPLWLKCKTEWTSFAFGVFRINYFKTV